VKFAGSGNHDAAGLQVQLADRVPPPVLSAALPMPSVPHLSAAYCIACTRLLSSVGS
jgi:hypothetical protein